MKILEATEKNILTAAEIIKSGGLVAFPTETVYGLGADGLDPIAVAKIFEAKQRPSFNPLILHVAETDQIKDIASTDNPAIFKLIDAFWPGPLTIVIPKMEIVPDIVTSGHPTVAVRMPDHEVALNLIKESGKPIAAPSANVFSKLSPTNADHVVKQLKDKVDIILDGGNCSIGVESTIIHVEKDEISLLRPGGLAIEEIENIVGDVTIPQIRVDSPIAPGQLHFHYAPQIPLKFFDEVNVNDFQSKKVGALFFKKNFTKIKFTDEKILSAQGDLREAAANLFSHLHDFENKSLDVILVERIDETGLGKAIMDRLRKAANKYV